MLFRDCHLGKMGFRDMAIFVVHFLLQGLTWAALGIWTQNYRQFVGTYPGYCPNYSSKSICQKFWA